MDTNHRNEDLPKDEVVSLFMLHSLYYMSREEPCALLTTDTGYVVKVPKEVEATDVLCTFYNCSKVTVLRPNPDGTSYILLAFAYVHGFDYREWTTWDGGEESQEFVLV